jgi:tetratricopeptide (TPR) repeat protein
VPGTRRREGGLRFDFEAARTGYPAAFAARRLSIGRTADLVEAAAQIGRSAVRDRLIAALDDWLPVALPADRPWLCDLLARVDSNPARNEVRRAHVEPDRLRVLFNRPPPEAALRLAARAAMSSNVPHAQALTVLRAAAARYPDDFRTQYAAAVRTFRADLAESVGYFRAAISLRKDNLAAVNGLGQALHQSSKPREAAPFFLRAIEIDPGFASAYLNLADTIKMGADPALAVAHFEREIAAFRNKTPHRVDRAMAYFGLGMALRDRDRKRAIAAFRKSLALDDRFAMAHHYLGYVLDGPTEVEERIQCYRRAMALDPTFAFPHYNLGNVLRAKGDVPGALAEYREAIRLFPQHTFSHLALGETLEGQKDLQGAAKHLRRVIELNRYFQSAYMLLGRVLLASDDAAGAADVYRQYIQRFPTGYAGYDGLVLALGRQGAHTEAVRVYQMALVRAVRTWPEQVRRRLRYNAACSAVLAGAGSGQDAPAEADRGAFRQQALLWLRAELDIYQKAFNSNPAEGTRAATYAAMKHWLADADLASTRDPGAVGHLSPMERDAWKQLWADVRRLHAAAAPGPRVGDR